MADKSILHYKILEKLGAGGMGVVYKARDTKLDRDVAIKFLPKHIASNADERKRFEIEAKAAAALNHPNIATIYSIEEYEPVLGEPGSEMFIVMEYIDGQELSEIVGVQDFEPLPIEEIIDYATQIASGLQTAHEKGVVHRDVKSSNIMVTKEGRIKVMDFGLAKMKGGATDFSDANKTVGTIAYMSPEQARGDDLDHRTDIWSLGVVLYEMLAGKLPFQGEYEQALLYSVLSSEPEALSELRNDVPEALQKIANKALQKKPDARYNDMGAFITALAALKASGGPSTVGRSQTEEKEPSVAVLPFANLSADSEQEYFCDGLTEEIINSLTQVENLQVSARTSAFFFKGKNIDIREIGEKLNVLNVLEGGVRKAGNRLRITAQLIRAENGFQIWSRKYDREMDDIFAIQDDIAAMITQEMTGMAQKSAAGVIRRHTENLRAYNLYLQARFHLNKRTEDGLKKSEAFCLQAIDIEKDYALAYAGLADSYILMGFQGFLPPREAMPKAKDAVEKALALDDSFAEAYSAKGAILATYSRDWAASEQAFKRAIELNEKSATAHYWFAIWCLIPQGRFEDCEYEIEKALDFDPLSLVLKTGMGWRHYFAGDFERSVAVLENVLEMDENFVFALDILGQCCLQQGKIEEAVAGFEKAVALSNRRPLSLSSLAHAYATGGENEKATAILDELLELSKTSYVSAYDVALVYSALKDFDQADAWFEKAYKDRNGWLNFLEIEPRLGSFRRTSQFQAYLKKTGSSPE